jgi:hypothetical protein
LDRPAHRQCAELIACLADRQLHVIGEVSHTGRLQRPAAQGNRPQ